MQVKKELLIKRVQKRIDKLKAQKVEHEAKLLEYLKALPEYYKACAEQAASATTYEQYRIMPELPKPEFPEGQYYWEDNMRAAKRNMALLEALEGDIIEVDKLKTGKNFTLDSLFEGILADE